MTDRCRTSVLSYHVILFLRSPFLYMALMGVAELPAYTITAPITQHFGRRTFLVASLLLTTVMHMILVVLMLTKKDRGWFAQVPFDDFLKYNCEGSRNYW